MSPKKKGPADQPKGRVQQKRIAEPQLVAHAKVHLFGWIGGLEVSGWLRIYPQEPAVQTTNPSHQAGMPVCKPAGIKESGGPTLAGSESCTLRSGLQKCISPCFLVGFGS